MRGAVSLRRLAPPVQIHGLRKRFGSTLAVDGLSFEVGAGRIVGFLGPNGAGKTTTLRSLLGLILLGWATVFALLGAGVMRARDITD